MMFLADTLLQPLIPPDKAIEIQDNNSEIEENHDFRRERIYALFV